METKLGRISALRIGLGGYQDVMFGISVNLGGDSWGVTDFKGFWSPAHMKRSDGAQWTEADRKAAILEAFLWLDQLMKNAKVTDANKLVGIPVEVTFDNMMLKSWRVLTEVL